MKSAMNVVQTSRCESFCRHSVKGVCAYLGRRNPKSSNVSMERKLLVWYTEASITNALQSLTVFVPHMTLVSHYTEQRRRLLRRAH